MPALFDAATAQSGGHAAFNHTPVGTPTLAVVVAHYRGATDGTTLMTGVNYGGAAMTLVKWYRLGVGEETPAASSGDILAVWEKESPASGTQSVDVDHFTGTAPRSEIFTCVTLTGTGGNAIDDANIAYVEDQINDKTSVQQSGVTGQTNGLMLDFCGTQENEDHTPDGGQTERNDTGDSNLRTACSTEPGAASVTMGWSWTTNSRYQYVILPINPSSSISDLDVTVVNMVDREVPLTFTAPGQTAQMHRSTTGDFTPDATTWIAGLGSSDTAFVDNEANSDTPPLPDVVYYYVITDTSYTVLSNYKSQQMCPPRPTTVIAGTVDDNSIEVETTHPSSTTRSGIQWWYKKTSDPDLIFWKETPSTAAYRIQTKDGLLSNTSYDFYIRTYSSSTGLLSGYTTLTQSTTGLGPDGVPDGLVASNIGTNSFDMDWNDNATNEVGYWLHISETPGFTPSDATRDGSDLGANAESGSFSGLDPETDYYVAVEVYNASGKVYSAVYGPVTTLAEEEGGAVAGGVFSYNDFRYGVDSISGRASPVYTIRGAVSLTGRDGLLRSVPAVSPPMAWLNSLQPTTTTTQKRLFPGNSLQAMRLFGAATNVWLQSADLSAWTLVGSCTRTLDYGEGANGLAEADLLTVSGTGYNGQAYSSPGLTIPDDSSVWVCSFYLEKQTDAVSYCRFDFQLTGGTTVTASIEIDPNTGQFVLASSPLFGFVRDEGARWLVVLAKANNSTGNTNLSMIFSPAYGSLPVGSGGDGTDSGTMTIWGLDVKNKPFWSPHAATAGTSASHTARDFARTWLLSPQPEAGYMVFVPWFVPGSAQQWYRIYSRGGDCDAAAKKGMGVFVSPTGTDRVGIKIANGTTTLEQTVNVTWSPGDVVEVAWRIVPTTLPTVQLYISVAVNWGAWSDAGPSATIDLPDVWSVPADALNETLDGETERACADYIGLKIHSDYTLTAEDMRQLFFDPAEGLSGL